MASPFVLGATPDPTSGYMIKPVKKSESWWKYILAIVVIIFVIILISSFMAGENDTDFLGDKYRAKPT